MEIISSSRSSVSGIGAEGALMALSPFPLLLPFLGVGFAAAPRWTLIIAIIASLACIICAFTLFRRPLIGRIFGGIATIGCYAVVFPFLKNNPFAALFGTVILIGLLFSLIHLQGVNTSNRVNRCLQRSWVSLLTVCAMVFLIVRCLPSTVISNDVLAVSFLISQLLIFHWIIEQKVWWYLPLPLVGFVAIGLTSCCFSQKLIPMLALIISLIQLLALVRFRSNREKKERWWEVLLDHPARILLTTFFVLCLLGSVFLILPISTITGGVSFIDAVFTSVSAVCVTGLIVLDTPHDFTLTGQFFILLLIQLGGLGIMSITTVALHSIGRRLSLKQERILTTITDTDHQQLYHSLSTILKFTFIFEGVGAIFLGFLFYSSGDSLYQAVWRGIFTSVSAFCNAGFALQSESLLVYQTHPAILQTIGWLIIFGGIAPATSLMIPSWLVRKQIPISSKIALVTTVVLLISGAVMISVFEWNGILAGLSLGDKLQNAWFQSITLRTAGFNSLNLHEMASPTYLIMLFLMFIGGSPGGTAGGIKTTTVGILAMTFWANITNRNDVIVQNRRILSATIYRVITIVISGTIVLFVVVMMLEVTQQISARSLIFEAISAIGTVGLSVGATARLDEIGKIIIIIAMFVGRIGPMTLFMLLSKEQIVQRSYRPGAKISLT